MFQFMSKLREKSRAKKLLRGYRNPRCRARLWKLFDKTERMSVKLYILERLPIRSERLCSRCINILTNAKQASPLTQSAYKRLLQLHNINCERAEGALKQIKENSLLEFYRCRAADALLKFSATPRLEELRKSSKKLARKRADNDNVPVVSNTKDSDEQYDVRN